MSSRKDSFTTQAAEISSNLTAPKNENISNNNANADTTKKSINLNEFLEFLNLSCHVNDMISQNSEDFQRQHIESNKNFGTTIAAGGGTRSKPYGPHGPIDFQKLSQNKLVNQLHGCNTKEEHNPVQEIKYNNASGDGVGATAWRELRANSKTKKSYNNEGLPEQLREKLDYVLNEGILDAVLPLICPVPMPANCISRLKPAKPRETKDPKLTAATTVPTADTCNDPIDTRDATPVTKDSSSKMQSKASATHLQTAVLTSEAKRDPDVVIHVCDEVKKTSKDFTCPQTLLVSKMGYFADVTAGQKLEDMDISVHCDIQIFEWLMKWVKSENGHESNPNVKLSADSPPILNVNNVIPILVSASFLQMEPLLLDCLSFCHAHLGDVVRVSNNLYCLHDTIITRMAAMFTNVELEMVCDKKNRLLPRLWIKLISSLFEPETEALRGHYYSLAGLFRCSKCQKCLTNTMKSYIQCIPGNVRLNRWGQIVSHHVREPAWDLNYFITQLFRELKSWRLVYWHLWGHAHYLYCCLCEMYFPVYQMSWCRYHPETPCFLGPIAEGRTAGPAGRYACCGQQAFRYETLPGPNGCQFREHSVLVETDRERSILSIVQMAIEGNALSQFPSLRLQEALANGKNEPRWSGITLMPQRCRQGLLPLLNPDESTARVARRVRPASSKFFAESSTETESTDTSDNAHVSKFSFASYNDSLSTSTSDGCESFEHKTFAPKRKFNKKPNKKSKPIENPGRYWSGELSARSNQDHQREFEERVMKQVMAMVQKRTGLEANARQQNRPLGGTYIKLEHEWREHLKQRMYGFGGSSITNTQSTNNTSSSNNTALTIKGARKKVDNSGQ